MPVVESVSSLIAEIYDAALDPTRWGTAMESTAKYIGGAGATIKLEIAEKSPHLRNFNHNDFWQKRMSTNPPANGTHLHPNSFTLTGNVYIPLEGAGPDKNLEIRLCDRPVAPGAIDGSMRCVARFAIHSPVSDDAWMVVARHHLELIFPHVNRAMRVGRAIVTNRSAVAALEDALDGMDAGVFLVNALGQMVDANSSGNAMLRNGGALGSARGTAIDNGPEATCALGETFVPGNSRAVGASISDSAQLEAAMNDTRFVAHSFPIAAAAGRFDCCDRQAIAGVILHEARLPTDDVVACISRHYRLALRERQVLQAIVDGYGVTEIAHRLTIAHSTAKTYVSRLFEKTCTKNQIELIKLCAAFRSPFSRCPDAR